MRLPAAGATVVVAGASLLAAWHTGAGRASAPGGGLSGISVVSAPAASSPRASTSSKHHRTKRASSSSASASPAASKAPVKRSYTGALVSTQFGNVQVRIQVLGKKLLNVTAVHLTDSGQHSVQISAHAAPILRREALAKQSARIDTVSGASYTSEGYRQSLQAALDAAHI